MRMVLGMGQRRSSCRAISQVGLGLSGVSTNLKRPLGVGLDLLDLYIYSKPRVRIAFPEFGFGSGLSLPGSDSDRFRRARFGFGSVSPGQVRIRIGFAGPGSDSDRIPHHETGFGSVSGGPAGLIADIGMRASTPGACRRYRHAPAAVRILQHIQRLHVQHNYLQSWNQTQP